MVRCTSFYWIILYFFKNRLNVLNLIAGLGGFNYYFCFQGFIIGRSEDYWESGLWYFIFVIKKTLAFSATTECRNRFGKS